MNLNVIKRMMTFDVIARIPGKKDALGNTQYQTVECKGYPVDDIITIYDNLGKMVTSSMQLYVTGNDGLAIPSTAILDIGNYVDSQFQPLYKDKPIIKRTIYYKPFGVADVGVFYMP